MPYSPFLYFKHLPYISFLYNICVHKWSLITLFYNIPLKELKQNKLDLLNLRIITFLSYIILGKDPKYAYSLCIRSTFHLYMTYAQQ